MREESSLPSFYGRRCKVEERLRMLGIGLAHFSYCNPVFGRSFLYFISAEESTSLVASGGLLC